MTTIIIVIFVIAVVANLIPDSISYMPRLTLARQYMHSTNSQIARKVD
jgi:hypothetical protein